MTLLRPLLLLAVFTPLAALAEPPAQSPESCAAIAADAERLACYDALAHRATAPSPAQTPTPAPTPAQAPAPAQTPAPARTPEQRFGAESLNQPPDADAPKDAPKIESHIVGPFSGWKRGAEFTLANGQVWKCTSDEDAYYPDALDSPAVVIRRGFFTGSYYMEIAATGRKIKVRRVR